MDKYGNVIGMVTARLADLETLKLTGTLPQNVNYAVKSSFIIAFLDSIPDLTAKLKPPHLSVERQWEEVAKEVQSATVLVLAN